MNTTKKVPIWMNIINAVLILAVLGWSFYRFFGIAYGSNFNVVVFITDLLILITAVFALFYSVLGYRKFAAVFFRAFLLSYAVTTLVMCVALSQVSNTNILALVCNIIIFAGLCVLLIAENLGKQKSFVISSLITGLTVVSPLINVIARGFYIESVPQFCMIVFAFIAGIMVYAKYVDKEERGTT